MMLFLNCVSFKNYTRLFDCNLHNREVSWFVSENYLMLKSVKAKCKVWLVSFEIKAMLNYNEFTNINVQSMSCNTRPNSK